MNEPKSSDLKEIQSRMALNEKEIALINLMSETNQRNTALRLLVEKWRSEAGYHNHPTSLYIRQCAKELEEALK